MDTDLQAGAAQVGVTPPLGIHLAGSFEVRPAEDVHDPLYAKAVVLSDGDTHLALVLLDLIMLPREDVEAIGPKRQTAPLFPQNRS